MKELDSAILGLAARQHGAFNRQQAYGAGASRSACDRRVAAGLWLRARFVGVYLLAGFPATWHQRLSSAVLAVPVPAVASHRSAAVLHGLRAGAPIEMTAAVGAHPMKGARLHWTELGAADRTIVAGIPTTTVDRTLIDLAGVVGPDATEQALEAALRLGLTTPERVRRRLDQLAAPGRGGVVRLRRVLERRDPGRAAGSGLEVQLIQLLRAAGLTEQPVRQFEVVVGGQRYLIDLAFPTRRLAIELDGLVAHGVAQFQQDRTRQNALILAGWTVLRFTWADVMERPDQVVATVALALAA